MPYQDILVHVRSFGSSEPVELAMRLARRFHARLTCLYPLRDTAVYENMLRRGTVHVQDAVERDYAAADDAESRFSTLAERERIALDWQVAEGEDADVVALAARLQDLVVVGQREPGDAGWGVAERMATTAGHATLVVPSTGPFPIVGKRVLVAWNGSAQAAAAVRRAMPFLASAEHVAVLVGEGREVFPTITRPPPLDVAAYLKRHGIAADIRSNDGPDAGAGATILETARNVGADLVVMGAFGRSRMSEWILGGATRHVLDRMHVPVLMAH